MRRNIKKAFPGEEGRDGMRIEPKHTTVLHAKILAVFILF